MLQEDGRRSRDPEAVLSEVEKGSADWRNLKLRKVMFFCAQLVKSIQFSSCRDVQEASREEMS